MIYEAKRSKSGQLTSNQKNEWNLQVSVTKKEFKVLYDALKCKGALLNWAYAMYSLEDVVLVLLHMCKNGSAANKAIAELAITFRDERNVRILTSQWLLGMMMIGAIVSYKMGGPCRCMSKSTIKRDPILRRRQATCGHRRTSDPIYRCRQAQ